MRFPILSLLTVLLTGCGDLFKTGPATPYGEWHAEEYIFNDTSQSMPDESASDNIGLTVNEDDSGEFYLFYYDVTTSGDETITDIIETPTYNITGSFSSSDLRYTFTLDAQQWDCDVDNSEMLCTEMLGDDEQIIVFDSGRPPL